MAPRWVMLIALSAGLCVLAAALAAALWLDLPPSSLTRDMQVAAGLPPYIGAVSVVNGMLWVATGSLSFFAGWLIPRDRRWLYTFGAFVFVLALDDLFVLHDVLGPDIGVSEEPVFLVYATTAGLLLLAAYRHRDRSILLAYLAGGSLLAGSVAVDVVISGGLVFLEDAAKLLGTCVWVTVPLIAYMCVRRDSLRTSHPETAPVDPI